MLKWSDIAVIPLRNRVLQIESTLKTLENVGEIMKREYHEFQSQNEDAEMNENKHSSYDHSKMQELIPFPIIEQPDDEFNVYLDKYANSKYKYMLAFVAEQCGPDKVKDVTCALASYQNKFSSDIWIGQEELYGPLEDVLNILMIEPRHKCFLQRVTLKEAPDYMRIIKNPMDMGRMNKKLTNWLYKSKSDFEVDIELIVSNCLLYNADPDNIYRAYALSLRDRAEILMKNVPEIEIKHISTLNPEELDKWKTNRSTLFLSKNTAEALNIPKLTFDPRR